MRNEKTFKIVLSALFAALVFVTTFMVKIPIPATSGYIHPGDAMVILSGIFLGPWYGAAAAAIGSMLSDAVGGYMLYVPATFIIKGLAAFLVGLAQKKLEEKGINITLGTVISSLISGVVVVVGYLAFELVIYGTAAFASVLPNVIQVTGGLLIATVLRPILQKIISLQRA